MNIFLVSYVANSRDVNLRDANLRDMLFCFMYISNKIITSQPYYYDRSPVEFRIVQPSQSPITTVSIRSNTRSNNNIRRDQQRSTNIVNIRTNCNAPSSNMISPMMPFFAPPIHSHSIYCHPLAQMRMSQQAIMQNCMIQSQLLLQQMQSGVMLQRQEMINQDKQNERKYQDKREERNHQERMLMLRQNTKSSNTGNITNNITVNGAATFNIKLGPVGLGSFLEKLIAEKAHSHDTEGVNYLKEKLTNFQAVKSSPHDVRRVPFKTLDDIDTSNRNLSGIRRSILDVRRFNTLKHFSGLGDYFTMDGTANQEGFDQDIPFSISTKLLSQLRHQNSDENCVITSISNALHFCAPKDDMVNQFASAVVKQRDVTYFTHERVNGADSAFIAQNIYVEHQKQTKYAKYTILQSLYYSKKSY